jgi:epsilon-lactone hydrolase
MPNEPSIQSEIVTGFLRLMRSKRIMPLLQEVNTGMNAGPPAKLHRRHKISLEKRMGRKVWTLSPSDDKVKSRLSGNHKLVFYLHGGSYVVGFLWPHWRFMGRLVEETGCTVVAPDYPLAPDHHVDDVFAMILPLYRELAGKAGSENITIMGDSAGGGLALALAQQLQAEGDPQPERLTLFAPWLDVTMRNPEIQDVDEFDPFLNIEGLVNAGKAYAGDRPPEHPSVSPVYGSLKGLAPISLYIGTRDLLVADCRVLKRRAEAAGLELEYREIEGLVHSGVLMPLPEAKEVRKAVVSKLLAPDAVSAAGI